MRRAKFSIFSIKSTSVSLRHGSSLKEVPKRSERLKTIADILVIANMGIERIAPGIPHIQSQKTSEMMTRTGLRVNRLARPCGRI